MNFHNSPHNNGITGDISHYHISEDILTQLTLQLQEKDKQIAILLDLIKSTQKQ